MSTGCPSGVGPEVSLAGAFALGEGVRVVLVGDLAVLRSRAAVVAVAEEVLVPVQSAREGFLLPGGHLGVLSPHGALSPGEALPGAPSRCGGAAQLLWVDEACDRVAEGEADALVTGPVSKAAIVASRAPGSSGFLGHTEHIQRRLGARSVTMAFWSRRFTASLVTTHLPISEVPRAITRAAVARAAVHTAAFLASLSPAKPLRLVVTGLNPHAGEGGLLGREDGTRIRAGIELARSRLSRAGVAVELSGPVPAESALRLARDGVFAGAVTMFHDQATIAMKLSGFGEAVNVSLGLPIVRTSVDHGTAYDRAGTGTADPRGMREALGLAARMVRAGLGNSRPR